MAHRVAADPYSGHFEVAQFAVREIVRPRPRDGSVSRNVRRDHENGGGKARGLEYGGGVQQVVAEAVVERDTHPSIRERGAGEKGVPGSIKGNGPVTIAV